MPTELAQIPPPVELDVQDGMTYAKFPLQRGFRFGPYPMKWTTDPIDKNIAWEVSEQFYSNIPFFAKNHGKIQKDIHTCKEECTPQILSFGLIVFASLTSQHIYQHHQQKLT